MAAIVFLTGALVTLTGAFLLLDLKSFRPLVEWLEQDDRLARVSFLRLLLAGVFYFAADSTRIPTITLIFAGIFLVSAIGYFSIGAARVKKIMTWWLDRLQWFALPYCLIAITMGTFLMWLAWPVTQAS